MKTIKNTILGVVLLGLLIIGASSIVITYENQYSLVRQFGKIDHIVENAGVSFKIPFIQSVDTLPKQTLLYDLVGNKLMLRQQTFNKGNCLTKNYLISGKNSFYIFIHRIMMTMDVFAIRIDNRQTFYAFVYSQTLIMRIVFDMFLHYSTMVAFTVMR